MFTTSCKQAIRKNASRSFSGTRPGLMHASPSILSSQAIIIDASLAAAVAVTAAAAVAVAAVRLT